MRKHASTVKAKSELPIVYQLENSAFRFPLKDQNGKVVQSIDFKIVKMKFNEQIVNELKAQSRIRVEREMPEQVSTIQNRAREEVKLAPTAISGAQMSKKRTYDEIDSVPDTSRKSRLKTNRTPLEEEKKLSTQQPESDSGKRN